VHLGIGIEDRYVQATELLGGGRFAHADAAREPDHLHACGLSF
jgi:hypothetical protein